MQELGLTVAYDKDDGTHRFIRSLMALPFLPAQEIEAQFDCIHQNCPPGPLEDLVNYVETTWINGTYPLEYWSIYGQPIRTNNDLEGYHNALNRRAGGRQNLPFYMLVELLHREVGLSLIQTRLVSQKKLKRHQRTIYRRLQGKIIGAWEDYSDSKITARQLLQTCSYINGPTRME